MKMFQSFRKSMSILAITAASAVVFVSCKKSDRDIENLPMAGVMAFNLAADKGAVVVGLSGTSLSRSALTYGSYTGAYFPIEAGNWNLEAYDNAGIFASSSAALQADQYYSAFVIGQNGNYSTMLVNDDFSNMTSNGKAYVRYVYAVPDSVASAVTITSNAIVAVNSTAAFGQVSAFTEVHAGNITIDVNNGSTVDADRTITVEGNKVYTILISGVPGNTHNQVNIRYITNGIVDDTQGSRVNSSADKTQVN